MRPTTIVLLVATLCLAGCASSKRASSGRRGFEQSGIASWYGPGFHGKTTANGETYDMEAMTAAHKQLPFGTIVEVRNRDNGRKTRVRINDRGPFVRGRIIDLSKAAARSLDMLGSGTAPVRIRIVTKADRAARQYQSKPPPAHGHGYSVQAGAFRERLRAESRLAAVRKLYPRARIESSRGLHRIVLTDLSKRTAKEVVDKLQRHGIDAVMKR